MGLFKRLGWAVALLALGAASATLEVGGKTPLQHLGAAVSGPVWHSVKAGADAAYERARVLLSVGKPVEHHSPEDRDALNKLIAKLVELAKPLISAPVGGHSGAVELRSYTDWKSASAAFFSFSRAQISPLAKR